MFNDLYNKVNNYIDSNEQLQMIYKSYVIANMLHEFQMRESGEPYISHPITVANILADMKQDANSISASLLHDVIEDADVTKEELVELLLNGEEKKDTKREMALDIVNLVDGVTKVKHKNYSAKLVVASCDDIRVMTIKLADRLHNMRTLQFKKDPEKRIKIALKTFNDYIPWAKIIGAYKIKYELEDLCFKEISPKIYKRIELFREELMNKAQEDLEKACNDLDSTFSDMNLFYIPKIKSAYGIYKSGYPAIEDGIRKQVSKEMLQDEEIANKVINNYHDINELVQLKIITSTEEECYQIAEYLIKNYSDQLVANSVRNYIKQSKKNMYKSLDFILKKDNFDIQFQIRTEEMDLVNCYGIMYGTNNDKGVIKPFSKDLKKEIIKASNEDEIIERFHHLATSKIVVTDLYGISYYLDYGSTIMDLAYKINSNLPDNMNIAIVNSESVRKNYVLEDGDIFYIGSKARKKENNNPIFTLKKA